MPQHNPAQQEAAVAIRPDQKQKRQQPQPPAQFQNHHRQREEHIREKLRPVKREWNRHGSGNETGQPGAIQHTRAPPRHQSGQPAERRQ